MKKTGCPRLAKSASSIMDERLWQQIVKERKSEKKRGGV